MARTYKPVPECPAKLRQVIKAANRLSDSTNELFEKLDDFIKEHNSRDFEESINDYLNYQKIAFQRFENHDARCPGNGRQDVVGLGDRFSANKAENLAHFAGRESLMFCFRNRFHK